MSLDEIRQVPMTVILDSWGMPYARAKTRCPIHNEKTASLSFKANLWHCFGCDAKGDTIRFVMLYKELDFLSAVHEISQLTNIPFDKSVRPKRNYERETLLANKIILNQMLDDEEQSLTEEHRWKFRLYKRTNNYFTRMLIIDARLNEISDSRKILNGQFLNS